MRSAERARLKRLLLFLHVPRYIEGVTLAVTEAVDDRPALASLLTDRLPQGLSFTPVALQVLSLRHHQSFLARGENLLLTAAPV